MIIGLNYPADIGSIENIDLIDPPYYRENVRVMIMREATKEEWLEAGSGTVEDLAIRMRQFPDCRFYKVSTD